MPRKGLRPASMPPATGSSAKAKNELLDDQKTSRKRKSDSLGSKYNTDEGQSPQKKLRSRSPSLKDEAPRKYTWETVRPRPVSRTTKGMTAPENSCYRVALLQVLFHQPAFYAFMKNVHFQWDIEPCKKRPSGSRGPCCTVKAIAELLELYWNVPDTDSRLKGQYRVPEAALRALTSAMKDDETTPFDLQAAVLGREQHDSAEYFDALNAQFSQAETDDNGRTGDAEWALPPIRPPRLADIFRIDMRQVFTCQDCGARNSTNVEDIALRVGLKSPHRQFSLAENLPSVFTDVLPLSCNGACAKSETNAKAKEREVDIRIAQAPEILFIQLKRFTTTFKKGKVVIQKVTNNVPMEEYLNLSGYCEDRDEFLMYRLDGVVAHRGPEPQGGHYIAGVRQQDGGTFVHIDNDKILQASNSVRGTVSTLYFDRPTESGTFHPYLLAYSRVRP